MAGAETTARRSGWHRPSKGEERRADLLQALEGLLAEHRLGDIGVDDIARAAGVRRTAFYFYFPNKAVAVAALLSDTFDEMIAGAEQFFGRTSNPATALREALESLWRLWRRHEPVMLAMLDSRDIDTEAREIWEAWLDRFVAKAAAVVDADRLEGRAPSGPEARLMVQLLVRMNAGVLEHLSRTQASAAEVERAIDGIVHIWARSVYGSDLEGPQTVEAWTSARRIGRSPR